MPFVRHHFGPVLLQAHWISDTAYASRNPDSALTMWRSLESYYRIRVIIVGLWLFVLILSYGWFRSLMSKRSGIGATRSIETTARDMHE